MTSTHGHVGRRKASKQVGIKIGMIMRQKMGTRVVSFSQYIDREFRESLVSYKFKSRFH